MLLSLVKMSHPDCFCCFSKECTPGTQGRDLKGKEQEKNSTAIIGMSLTVIILHLQKCSGKGQHRIITNRDHQLYR